MEARTWTLWFVAVLATWAALGVWWDRYTRAHGRSPAHTLADRAHDVRTTWARRYTVRKEDR